MWWKKKPQESMDVQSLIKLIKDEFENLYDIIERENPNLEKKEKNMILKNIISYEVNQIIISKCKEEDEELLKEFKNKYLKTLDDIWAKKEPDRVMSLLE